jgi:GntR family transcriptional regulator/MocR family aminotransferase
MDDSNGVEPLFPDRGSDEPLARQFARRLRQAIESGLYRPSSRLLPSRELARRLGLSRNTVTSAIEQLIAEGYLESRVGSGTFVVANVVRAAAAAEPFRQQLPATSARFETARSALQSYDMGFGPLRAGVPDLTKFPVATWARITRRKLAALPEFLDYGDARGEPALREAIAQHLQQFRGVTTDWRRVIVVEGTQGALRLAADVLLAEGEPAVVEDPSYPFAWAALASRNVRLAPVPVDDAGMIVALAPPARVAFVSPSHQFPLGSTMSLERRRALLAWARRNDGYVVEDDYDSEYAYDGKPLPSLQSIDRDERVVYIGTFSKTLAPALRIGYLIVPPHLAEVFALARQLSTLGGTRYVAATLADFLMEGHFARHVRRMTIEYRKRRTALVELLANGLPGERFSLRAAHAGLHLAIVAPPGFDDVAAAAELYARGVYVQPLSSFCVARTDCRGFVVGYGAAPLPEILEAARMLVHVARSRA